MSFGLEKQPGVTVARVAWAVIGIVGILLHLPLTRGIGLAFAVPWTAVFVLLLRPRMSARLLDGWRSALASRSGAFGATALFLVALVTGFVVDPGAGLLLLVVLVAGLSLICVWRGGGTLREHLAGWAMLAIATGSVLAAGEAILRVPSVAARVGTPREIDAWWVRYDGLWERNVLGIRSPYETMHKEPGVLRIVALGDSFTWGDKIASPDSLWPARLEADLTVRMPDTRTEVVNLGDKGFTTLNEAEFLRRLGWQFDPDAVVVQFYLNDILPGGPNFERGYSGWIFPRAWLLPERYKHGHAGRSALLYVAESILTGWQHGGREAQAAKWTEVYERRGPEWDDLAGALREMGTAATRRGVPIVLMLFPDFIPGLGEDGHNPLATIHDQVSGVAVEAGFSVLDLTPIFVAEGRDMRDWWATPYDSHPNAAAAGVAARSLADHLMGILNTAGPAEASVRDRHEP